MILNDIMYPILTLQSKIKFETNNQQTNQNVNTVIKICVEIHYDSELITTREPVML